MQRLETTEIKIWVRSASGVLGGMYLYTGTAINHTSERFGRYGFLPYPYRTRTVPYTRLWVCYLGLATVSHIRRIYGAV